METVNNIKVIFLDIDGVLNTSSSLEDNVHLLPEKCLRIAHIAKTCDAKIVISSSWRRNNDLLFFKSVFNCLGIPKHLIIDKTPCSNKNRIRGYDIAEWLSNNEHVISYIIIDDSSDFFEYQKRYHIKTRKTAGISFQNMLDAINLLNN